MTTPLEILWREAADRLEAEGVLEIQENDDGG